jgi:uroporphyrinogen III methyltransferase / synthase
MSPEPPDRPAPRPATDRAACAPSAAPGDAAREAGPLADRRVLIMRPAHQIPPTAALVRAAGGEPVGWPSIAIEPPPDPARVEQAVAELGSYDLVAFTSENAVEALWQAVIRAGRDAGAFGRARIAAIGRATTEALRAHGLTADIVPERAVGEALGSAILGALGSSAVDARVLLPRALEAREVLPEMLRAARVRLDVVAVYQTVAASAERAGELRLMLERDEIAYVLLCSSSTVTSLCSMLGAEAPALLAHTRLASIGPVTTQTAAELGLTVTLTAPHSSTEGLIQAIAAHARGSGR